MPEYKPTHWHLDLPNEVFIPDRESHKEIRYPQESLQAPTEERVYIPPTNEQLAQTKADVRSFECTTVTDVPETECEALVALYDSTNGAGWVDNTNWLTSNTAGEWFGITVEGGHVTLINLWGNQLFGPIPSEMGSLINLSILDLGINQLNGPIPTELGNLVNLEELYLSGNQLTGLIPTQLGNLTNLRYIDFCGNQLSGAIPTELGNLVNLEELYLWGNQLSGQIPSDLGNLSNINDLYLNSNQLTGPIPQELGDLTNLFHLNLSNNSLAGDVPESFTDLINLCEATNQEDPCYGEYGLNLGYNNLTVPAEEPTASFLELKDPDWYLTQAIQQEILGDTGDTLISYDENIEIVIPPNSFEGIATFIFDPQPYPNQSTGSLSFAGNSFELTAWVGTEPLTSFDEPLVFTIHYNENAIGAITEDNLILYYWDEDQTSWLDAVTTCEFGEYTRNLEQNWLSLPVCHLSEFALMTNPFNIYLPMVMQ